MRFGPSVCFLCNSISRHFSSVPKLPKLPKLRKIRCKYRAEAVLEAQQALTEYLFTTRSLSFTNAEHIGKNSLFSISDLISRIKFSRPDFVKNFQKFLRYHPINEFEFFFESIGIAPSEISGFLPARDFFLSEDENPLRVASALSALGFPWTKLGRLYKEEISIFFEDPEYLIARVFQLKSFGFHGDLVVGICLAFPCILCGNSEHGSKIDALLEDLKSVFIDFGLMKSVDGNVDTWYEICRKIRLMYDLDCEKGNIEKLMGCNFRVLLECPLEVLVQKAEYFCRFGVRKKDVHLLLLRYPEILNIDLESPEISVLDFLKHIGLGDEELNYIAERYPYVLGKNKLANLPHLMRAMNLHEWFINKMKNGGHHLLVYSVSGIHDEDLERNYKERFEGLLSARTHHHNMGKLNFLLGIGFGENLLTIKALSYLSGSGTALRERFDCLLRLGIEFSQLCRMVCYRPKILNQSTENLEAKVTFLCSDIGCPLKYLELFPGFLCFNLEKRIKPRYRFHSWLGEKGLIRKTFTAATIVAHSEKAFIAHLSGIHPAAPKLWLECFSPKDRSPNSLIVCC